MWFANARDPSYEADDFLAATVKRKGLVIVASGDRDTFRLVSDSTTVLFPARAPDRPRLLHAMVLHWNTCPISSRCAGPIRQVASCQRDWRGRRGWAPSQIRFAGRVVRRRKLQTQADALRLYQSIATMDSRRPSGVPLGVAGLSERFEKLAGTPGARISLPYPSSSRSSGLLDWQPEGQRRGVQITREFRLGKTGFSV